jgi:flagellar hook-associated protein 3 FlgL
VNRPSDDPIDARRAVNLQALLAENEQYLANVTDVSPFLNESASELQRVVDIIQRARELTLQGSNETNAQPQLDAIALEINQLLEDAFGAGNHQTNDRFIFGGTRTLTAPFEATRAGGEITAVTYLGNTQTIDVQVADGNSATVNEPGSTAFQSTVDVFEVLIGIRDDLRAGDQVGLQSRIDELADGQQQILLSESKIGATQNRLDRIAAATEDYNVQLQRVLSEKVDADLAETIVSLNAQQNALEAALNAAGRVLQPSLLDFIR